MRWLFTGNTSFGSSSISLSTNLGLALANWGGAIAHGSSSSDLSTIWYLPQAGIGRAQGREWYLVGGASAC